jgi:hypothetical protein
MLRMDARFQQNVFWFQITMNQPRFFQHSHRVEQLAGKHFDELRAQTDKLILLDELVEVGREKLEDKAKMLLVNKGVPHTEDMVLVIRVALFVQLAEAVNQATMTNAVKDSNTPIQES